MALLNRFFNSRKRPFARSQDNVSEKLFTFTNEQVRVIVFRECDFRGRKLLFDSRTVQKVALADAPEAGPEQDPKKFVEISSGHAYTYTRPSGDVARLGEMIFGSVAMSFRGTTYKMHSVPVPAQLVCSQVFPSPKNPIRLRRSAPSHVHAGFSIEHSIRLEDSGASSATSGSDQSVLSGASDTVLVCKRQQSVPLDVPVNFSLVSSSGYGEEHSYSSISSGPQSISVDLSQGVHSGDSLNRRWPCSTNASMDPSTGSLPGSVSTDESFHKGRSSKIGLAVLIELTDGEEEKLEQFLMEHAALIEMLMWRVRQSVEGAYIRHSTFVSVMYDISAQTAHWLVDLLNGARLLVKTWHSHFPNCDNLFSIIKKSPSISFLGHLTDSSPKRTLHSNDRDAVRYSTLVSGGGLFSSFKGDSSGCVFESGGEFSFVNLSRFLKSEPAAGKEEGVFLAEKFVKEFCELLESVDVKHTNFFISTLVTAVLTHHLGWVNTVLPVALQPNKSHSSNPFWSQLSELYGAIGYPLKMSRTVVSGSNKSDLVPKILNALKYFIRCTEVSRQYKVRVNIDWENERADAICSANSCIPKENYKRYEDHLREIEEFTRAENEQQVLKLKMPNAGSFIKTNRKLELSKTHTCLSKLCDNQEKHTEILDRVTNMGLQAINPGDKIDVACSFLQNMNHQEQQLVDINEAKQQIERVFSPKKKFGDNPLPVAENTIKQIDGPSRPLLKSSKSLLKIVPVADEPDDVQTENNNVVFVLGENEELVGIKRETTPTIRSTENDYCRENNSRTELDLKEKSQFFHCGNESLVESTPEYFSFSMKEKLHELPKTTSILESNLSLTASDTMEKLKTTTHFSCDETHERNLPFVVSDPLNYTADDDFETPHFNIRADFSLDEIDNSELHRRRSFRGNGTDYSTTSHCFSALKSLNLDSTTQLKRTSPDVLKIGAPEVSEIDTTLNPNGLEISTPDLSEVGITFKPDVLSIGTPELSEIDITFKPDVLGIGTPKVSEIDTTFKQSSTKGYKIEAPLKSSPELNETTTSFKRSSSEAYKSSLGRGKEFRCADVDSLASMQHDISFEESKLNKFKASDNYTPLIKSPGDPISSISSAKSKGKACRSTNAKSSPVMLSLQKSSPGVLDFEKCPPEVFQFQKSSPEVLEFEKSFPRMLEFENSPPCEGLVLKQSSPEVHEFKKSSANVLQFQRYPPELLKFEKSAPEAYKTCIDTPGSLYEDVDASQFTKCVGACTESQQFSTKTQRAMSEPPEPFTEVLEFQKSSSALDNFQKLLESSTSPFKDSDFTERSSAACLKPSTSFAEKQVKRAMSEPPHVPKPVPCTSTKYKYTGVKFNFQQYPQIVENYMKNKNIELSNVQFSEKKLDFRWQSSESTFDFSRCDDGDYEEGEPLTTPSNASELEFTSELVVDMGEGRKAEEVVVEAPCRRLEFTRNVVPNTVIKEPNPYEHAKLLKDARNRRISEERTFSNLKIVELPMPRSVEVESHFPSINYTNSLIRDLDDHYVSDMVLQGTSAPKREWEPLLKKDLVLSTQHSFSDQQVEESIAIVANTDTWEVQLMSSHTYVIDRSAAGVPVGMSQLVANMLETLLHMWRLHTPAEYCLMHIEQQLQEFCLRSKALAQLLLDTDFCSMEILTSTLRLEVNDVPLLMAIASTHTPQVTQKYGLSFQ